MEHIAAEKQDKMVVDNNDEEVNGDWNQQEEIEDEDGPLKAKTKSLAEIYEKCNVTFVEPSTFEEASKEEGWLDAMKEEMCMIEKNQIWKLVKRPKNRNVIGLKWVYRAKMNPGGSLHKLKARLVVKGYAQQPGVDFGDTFAAVARHDTIRLLIALAAKNKWKMFHLDVKSAFLNGDLEEEIFVDHPQGFEVARKEGMVYKLYKALYGLKQAPKAWYSKIDSYLVECGFRRSENEATLYTRKDEEGKFLIVSLYVDDMLVTGSDEMQISNFKSEMERVFEMSDLGLMTYFLGIEIHQDKEGNFISQQKYARDILKKFKMESCKAVATPLVANEKLSKENGGARIDESVYRSLIGSLLYLTITRRDLMFAASLLSRFMQAPGENHMVAAKRVLRYVKSTQDYGIWFKAENSVCLQGFSDSDWAGSLDDSKSTSGYAFSFGSGVFSWSSKKQEVLAQSSTEAECIIVAGAANQALWLRKMMEDLDEGLKEPIVIWVDNKSTILIARNLVFHGRSKHIKVKFHALRQAEANYEIKLQHCCSNDQVVDILTKGLQKGKFE